MSSNPQKKRFSLRKKLMLIFGLLKVLRWVKAI